MTHLCSQVRKQANPSSWSCLHKRSGQCIYFNHAIYCSFFFLFFYTSVYITEEGSTIDPEGEENTRISSAPQLAICGGFLPCNKYHFFVHFFPMLFEWRSRYLLYGPEKHEKPFRKETQDQHFTWVKCVARKGHQQPRVCPASSQISNFEKDRIRFAE